MSRRSGSAIIARDDVGVELVHTFSNGLKGSLGEMNRRCNSIPPLRRVEQFFLGKQWQTLKIFRRPKIIWDQTH